MKNILKVLFAFTLLPFTFSAFACQQTSTAPDQSDFYDYTQDVSCYLDYNGHTFLKDGVEQVDLSISIDGDTAHFYTSDRNLIKTRFYGVDTPESTGKVQPYGVPAKKYTAEILEKADKNGTIAISTVGTDYHAPSTDSTGERYLALIWVNTEKENCPVNELKLLNLMLVQEGLSYVKNVQEMPEYADTFYAAEKQAEAFKKNLFSGEPDPYFNYSGDYADTSLHDIKKEILLSLEDPNHENKYDNQKVRVMGTVAGYSNHILYIENYDPETKEYAGINIFTGMSPISSKFTTRNTYIQVSGLCVDDDNFGFQMTDCSFNQFSNDPKNAQVIIPAKDNTDEFALKAKPFAPNELDNGDTDYLYNYIELTESVKVIDAYKAKNGNEFTLTIADLAGNKLPYSIYVPFIYKPYDGENANVSFTTKEDWIGKKFNAKGVYTYHKTAKGNINWQINPSTREDLVLVEDNQ